MSGEGADELFGGYLYFHKAPNAKEFHEETVRKVKDLHKFDCLRANKSTMAWGVEARVPFLDREFIEYAMSLDPESKMCGDRIEKHLIRNAFDDKVSKTISFLSKHAVKINSNLRKTHIFQKKFFGDKKNSFLMASDIVGLICSRQKQKRR